MNIIGKTRVPVRTSTMSCNLLLDCRSPTCPYLDHKRTLIMDNWIKFDRWQDRVKKIEKEKHLQKAIKHWLPRPKNSLFPPVYITLERQEHDLPSAYKPLDEKTREDQGRLGYDGAMRLSMLRYLDLSEEHLERRRRYNKLLALQYDQRLIPESQITLGADLAAAHFLVNRSAAVKFVGDDTWHQMNDKGDYVLPSSRVTGLYLEAIDASKTDLMYEAFDHLIRLKNLRYLSLADCPYTTDWCLSRMNQFETSLEFLDLSNCKRISAQGLGGLSCLKKLKYLRLDGLGHVTDIAKASLMLEQKISGLRVLGVNYDVALEEVSRKDQLLSDSRVREDARGNVYMKDDLGEMYYLQGNVSDRPVLDEDDLPLVHSKIRLDPPVAPYETADRINRLCGGKLKHLLAGLPSGETVEETERIFSIDYKRAVKKGVRVNPVLFPNSMQKEAALEAQKVLKTASSSDGDDNSLLSLNTVRVP